MHLKINARERVYEYLGLNAEQTNPWPMNSGSHIMEHS